VRKFSNGPKGAHFELDRIALEISEISEILN
jgi:hypothetical protein